MSDERRVTLRSLRDADGIRHLEARLTSSGDLVIEGQDLGSGVERFWGEGLTEYEWTITVPAASLPSLKGVLGGTPDDEVLDLLVAGYAADPGWNIRTTLDASDIPSEFWSRIGD